LRSNSCISHLHLFSHKFIESELRLFTFALVMTITFFCSMTM
jgi:hypothetical protein